MGSFGEHLRREREMRGISLDEIVASTKIGRRLLVALEEEQFDLLPGGIFNKSYVRAYAKCVGMNEDEAVAKYLEAAQEPTPDTKVIAHQHAFHSDHRPERSGFPMLPVFILVVVAIGAAGGWQMYQTHQRSREQQAAKPAEQAAAAPAGISTDSGAETSSPTQTMAPAGSQRNTAPTSSPSVPAENSSTARMSETTSSAPATGGAMTGASFEVTIRPKDRAWVSVKSDGKFVVRGIIKPPDVKTVRANNEVIFYTGNAGEVEVAFNGKAVPLSGGANDPQTVVFDSRGVLARAAAQ